MDALRQRLKELDWQTFQSLCFHVLKEKYPGVTLTHVEGAAGDKGLDIFEGEMLGKPTIWQAKSFPNGVGESQKSQIRESLKTALKHFTPSNWILCLSVDMDEKANRWFERWKKSHASRVKIGQFPASDMLHELIYRRTIRNHFFPNAVLDPVELKRLITRTGELTAEELERLTENNLEDFVERLKDRDARCTYEIVFDGDSGPPSRPPIPRPGQIASISNGSKTINVFARDIEGLSSNPPTFTLSMTGAGVEKYRELMKTGRPQEFADHEFGPLTSDWPVLKDFVQKHGPGTRLMLGPSHSLTSRKRNVRVTFRKHGDKSIEYGLMEARPIRAGTEEAEFVCVGDNLPFRINVTFPIDLDKNNRSMTGVAGSQITFNHQIVGSSAKQVKKFLDAVALLQPSGEIEIFDLHDEVVFLTAEVRLNDDWPVNKIYRRFVNDIAQIADRFNVDLRIPSKLSDKDLESILFLKTLADTGTLDVGKISTSVVKSEENKELVPSQLADGGGSFRFAHPRQEPKPHLFGLAIDTGPFAIEVEVKLDNVVATLEQFKQARVGDAVQFSFQSIGPARLSLLSAQEWQGGIATIPLNV